MISLLVLSDFRSFSECLALAVERDARLIFAGAASTLAEAFLAIPSHKPDVLLVDFGIAEDGLHAIKAARLSYPEVKVIAIAVPDSDREVIACVEAGAVGYVTRDASLDELVGIVHSVHRGELICSPRVAAALCRRVNAIALANDSRAMRRPLTGRETDVLGLLERGLTNKGIANELRIEVATVKNHIHSILEKLRVARRGEAAAVARNIPRPRRISRSAGEWAGSNDLGA